MGTKAVISLRVSTDEQAKPGHFGLEAQMELWQTYCDKQGYTVIEITEDKGISGKKPQRPLSVVEHHEVFIQILLTEFDHAWCRCRDFKAEGLVQPASGEIGG